MPVLLDGAVNFPVSYSPWYVYVAHLVASPASFTLMDLLFPDGSGNFDRDVTDEDVLITGYCFALEAFQTGMTDVQVAVPGSVVPFIADVSILPLSLVCLHYTSSVQTVKACSAAQFAAGKCLGRLRCHNDSGQTLRITAANDIVLVATGVC
jgi:NO-binding membrane sensor protein with MHYT domain